MQVIRELIDGIKAASAVIPDGAAAHRGPQREAVDAVARAVGKLEEIDWFADHTSRAPGDDGRW